MSHVFLLVDALSLGAFLMHLWRLPLFAARQQITASIASPPERAAWEGLGGRVPLHNVPPAGPASVRGHIHMAPVATAAV
ncbi:hypothetical protein CMUS01_02076 [Colletotrichum musicola]|uniref:Uncharacterized protein n=1 Tax=Colletotrichum musicola TaxID=2175873 RepID=A0A8H6NVN0_9PEZI|nr:hypothetical protein CMUS01_02076 [Colletotrichum musicola]